MRFDYHLKLLILAVAVLSASISFAAEPQLAFDLVPDPRPSVTDIEDPDWENTPDDRGGSTFIANIRQALEGNAVAMVFVGMYAEAYGDLTEKKYPRIPKNMHYSKFWLDWAERFTSKGWAAMQASLTQKDSWRDLWVTIAAKAGNAEGMYLASKSMGSPPEDRKERFWKAIELGNRGALVDLAWAYQYGGIVERMKIDKDPQKGEEYIKKAAAVGAPIALVYMACNYDEGINGCPKDPATAYIYYLLAKHFATDPEDSEDVRYCSQSVQKIPHTLPAESLELAKKTAAEWIASYTAPYDKVLEDARKRRTPLLEEFRKELSPVIEWLNETDKNRR